MDLRVRVGGRLAGVTAGRWTPPVRPSATCSWAGTRCRRSATWLTMPTVRPPSRRSSRTPITSSRVVVEAAEALVDEEGLQQRRPPRPVRRRPDPTRAPARRRRSRRPTGSPGRARRPVHASRTRSVSPPRAGRRASAVCPGCSGRTTSASSRSVAAATCSSRAARTYADRLIRSALSALLPSASRASRRPASALGQGPTLRLGAVTWPPSRTRLRTRAAVTGPGSRPGPARSTAVGACSRSRSGAGAPVRASRTSGPPAAR